MTAEIDFDPGIHEHMGAFFNRFDGRNDRIAHRNFMSQTRIDFMPAGAAVEALNPGHAPSGSAAVNSPERLLTDSRNSLM